MTQAQKLVQNQKQFLRQLRESSKAQQKIWQQIPEWSYRADGRSGYSDQYSRAWHQSLWAIESSANNRNCRGYTVYVDLLTGEIVAASDKRQPAHDTFLSACDARDFDAAAILASLKRQARKPFSTSFNFEEQYQARMKEAGFDTKKRKTLKK